MQTIKKRSTFPLVVRKGHSCPMSAVLTAYMRLWGPKLTPKRQFSTPSLHSIKVGIPSLV